MDFDGFSDNGLGQREIKRETTAILVKGHNVVKLYNSATFLAE